MCIRFATSHWVKAIAVLSMLAVASPALAQVRGMRGPGTASRIQNRTYNFKEANMDIAYSLFVPSKYDKEKKTPLMVALHGLGSNPRQIIGTRGFTDLAEQYGYIIVAPMGYNERGWYGSRGLTSANDTPTNLGELSEKDVMNVFEIVRKEFNVDPNKTYLMGHSMGGAGTWYLGGKHPDLWAALAPVAPAAMSRNITADLRKVIKLPVIMLQGDQDTLVTGNRRWVDAMKQLNMTYEYDEIPGAGHVDVIAPNMNKIFEFFEKHPKATVEAKKPDDKALADKKPDEQPATDKKDDAKKDDAKPADMKKDDAPTKADGKEEPKPAETKPTEPAPMSGA